MKRLHLSLGVADLAASVAFYRAFFRAEPTALKDDYAKWMLDDPYINFVVHTQRAVGLDHLGIQVASPEALATVDSDLAAAALAVARQTDATCCYARSDKAWVADPDGHAWEAFYTNGLSETAGGDGRPRLDDAPRAAAACCQPKAEASCCVPG